MSSLGALQNSPSLLNIAREAIRTHLDGEPFAPQQGPPSQGVFVTLWGPGHHLRGCIGRMQPLFDDLHEEVASCAVAAATRDPRFAPLKPPELEAVAMEISLLGPEEEVATEADLDPAEFGVVVRAQGRTGVLLPAVEGVENAREQVDIALRKGGINRSEAFKMSRFHVVKLKAEA